MRGPSSVLYVSDRYEELADLLDRWNYAIDRRAENSRWHERELKDPPTGLVRIRGVCLFNGEPQEAVAFSLTEWWVRGTPQHGAARVRGNTLVAYSYHGQAGEGVALRFDYDPFGHPEMPAHVHRPGSSRRAAYGPVEPAEALEQFEELLFEKIAAGRLKPS